MAADVRGDTRWGRDPIGAHRMCSATRGEPEMARWSATHPTRVGTVVAARYLVATVLLAGTVVGIARSAGAAAAPVVADGTAGYVPASVPGAPQTPVANQFDVLTLVTGGAAAVDPSSLTIVTGPASGTTSVAATASSGIVTFTPAATTVGTQLLTFAYCAPGVAYSPGAALCTTATLTYVPSAALQPMGATVSVLGASLVQYQSLAIAAVMPAQAAQGSTLTISGAPGPFATPSAPSGLTLSGITGFTAVLPVPAGLTYVPGSITTTGGDATTSGHLAGTYCSAPSPACTAQTGTADFPTAFPYLELQLDTTILPTASVTLPTVSAQFEVTGPVGATAGLSLAEVATQTTITSSGGSFTVAFDGYPTSAAAAAAGTAPPPYVAPALLASTTITAAAAGSGSSGSSGSGSSGSGSGSSGSGSGSGPSGVAPAAPGSPRSVTVSSVPGGLAVSWSAPTAAGGAPIAAYLVGTVPPCPTCSGTIVPGDATTTEIRGLPDGTTVTVWVVAVSSTRTLSGRSPPVTVRTTPASATLGCPTGAGTGVWLVEWDGSVTAAVASGPAPGTALGSMAGRPLAAPVVGLAPTPGCGGYWELAADGGVFAFGDAPFLGAATGDVGSRRAVGIAATPDGRGYWLAASDGAVYAFGDAPYLGSLPGLGIRPQAPISTLVATPDGGGYWLVGADGAVYAFGDARFLGSLPGLGVRPAGPVLAMAPAADGQGYWLASADGGIYCFGTARFAGAPATSPGAGLVTSIAAAPGGGYWTATAGGTIDSFGGAPALAPVGVQNSPVWALAPF